MPSRLARQLGFDADDRPIRLLGEAGYLHLAMGRLDAATDAFEAQLALDPDDPTASLGLAETHLMRDQPAEAHARAEQTVRAALARPGIAARDRVNAAWGHVIAGRALVHLERMDDARTAFAQARTLDPEGAAGQQAHAFLSATGGHT